MVLRTNANVYRVAAGKLSILNHRCRRLRYNILFYVLELTMWGDNPDDYKQRERDPRGFWSVALPTSERINDDWVVDVEWIFQNYEHAVCCIARYIRFTGEGFRECPQHIQDSAKKTVEMLWSRYQENVVKNT